MATPDQNLLALDFSETMTCFEEKLISIIKKTSYSPSTRNTQPWQFSLKGRLLEIHSKVEVDRSNTDTEHREQLISIGCMLETFELSSRQMGLEPNYQYYSFDPFHVRVHFNEIQPEENPLFNAIEERQTPTDPFKKHTLLRGDKETLQTLADSMSVFLSDDSDLINEMDNWLIRSDLDLYSSPTFVNEVKATLETEPHSLTNLVNKLHQFAQLSTCGTCSPVLGHPNLIGVLRRSINEKGAWIDVGQKLQRMYLTTTQLGLKLRPIARLINHDGSYERLKVLTGIDNPDLVFYIGQAPKKNISRTRKTIDQLLKT